MPPWQTGLPCHDNFKYGASLEPKKLYYETWDRVCFCNEDFCNNGNNLFNYAVMGKSIFHATFHVILVIVGTELIL